MNPYYQDKWVTIYHGDCREILPQLDVKVDLVLTDPPYGKIGGSKAIGGSNFVSVNSYDLSWDYEPINRATLELIRKMSVHQIIWGANYFWDCLPPTNSLIIWDKKCQNNWDDTFSDGEIAWTSMGKKLTIFRFLWVGALRQGNYSHRQHPTEKPQELMRWCIAYAGQGIKSIADPFVGIGATLQAAKFFNIPSIGIEIEEKYCEIAARRCSQEVMELV